MNRFHSKNHSKNHHSEPTSGYVDSSYDPIGSELYPFIGSFNISAGNITLTNTLTISGDLSASGSTTWSFSGGKATEAVSGVLRIATTAEASAMTLPGLAVTPEHLNGVLASAGAFAHSLSSTKHTDVSITTPISGQTLIYDTTVNKWKNSVLQGTNLRLATNSEAATATVSAAITPFQLKEEIRKRKPFFKQIKEEILAINPGGTECTGILAFCPQVQTYVGGTGNHSITTTFYGLSVYVWTGTTWNQVR